MERYFIIDKYNTWYDWRLLITAKSIPDAEPHENYVALDGAHGTLDLSESLTGEITYADRVISASFWTDNGNRAEREKLLRDIARALHGKKVKIIEPDDPTHYFYGRVKIKASENILPYATLGLEMTVEPWRYAIDETVRHIEASYSARSYIFHNNGVKTVSPLVTVSGGTVTLTYKGAAVTLSAGSYRVSDIKLYQGVNVIGVSGTGTVTFSYREGTL